MPVNSSPETGYQAPNNSILRLAFKILCVIAVSRESLDHWEDTKKKEWKDHVSIMVNQFQNTNITAGLVLATATLFLSSVPPIEHLMAYNFSISYIFAMVSFGAALLSVISGSAVLVIYETSTAHKDMETLKRMPRHQVIALLLWLAYPSVLLSTPSPPWLVWPSFQTEALRSTFSALWAKSGSMIKKTSPTQVADRHHASIGACLRL
ncbi:uncharacterized protein F5891DRAFT_141040 [Suillus fuscotomentosus]|uniref:Uncharacterized protein n=1 Tax=Suillus fuscotomentosus TaxID=1912939 RepID=A0AAD4HCU7_9AGAM|nr:uncharacterized protein F5891DRAFT_141040 [Suillus fuscotomentosus]KAG1889597.1 hypothetical protein F5891DRAFT_141040 [Suillus fuscotomentosus]